MAFALFKDGKQVGEACASELEAATGAMEAGSMAVLGRALSASEMLSLYRATKERGIAPANVVGATLTEGYEIREVPD